MRLKCSWMEDEAKGGIQASDFNPDGTLESPREL